MAGGLNNNGDRIVATDATAVAIDSPAGVEGVLLRGVSGSGKSDLALRLIDEGSAGLVSDDGVEIRPAPKAPLMTAPATIAGRMEVRGIGIVSVPPIVDAPLRLVVDLVGREEVPRLPEPEFVEIAGDSIHLVKLHAFDESCPAKIRLALTLIREGRGTPDDAIGPGSANKPPEERSA